MTLPLWHPCATRGCLTFVPVRGEVCRWCEQAAESVRVFVAAIGLGVLPMRSVIETTTEAACYSTTSRGSR